MFAVVLELGQELTASLLLLPPVQEQTLLTLHSTTLDRVYISEVTSPSFGFILSSSDVDCHRSESHTCTHVLGSYGIVMFLYNPEMDYSSLIINK